MQKFTVDYNWLFWLEEGRSSFECPTVLTLLLLLLVESFSWGSRSLTCQPPKCDEPGVHGRYCCCWWGVSGVAEFLNLGSGPRRNLVGQWWIQM